MVKTQDDRLFYVSEAIRRGIPIEEIADLTKIDIFFLDRVGPYFFKERTNGKEHEKDV